MIPYSRVRLVPTADVTLAACTPMCKASYRLTMLVHVSPVLCTLHLPLPSQHCTCCALACVVL